MKRIYTLLLLGFILSLSQQLWGQIVPQGISYQAVVRDQNGLLSNSAVTVEFTVIQSGSPVYRETQTITTNPFGLFEVTIGNGISSLGTFDDIDWASGGLSIQVQAKTGTNQNFVLLGIKSFETVPYSFYAETAGSVENINLALDSLADVSTGTPNPDDILRWNDTIGQWVSSPDKGGLVDIISGDGILISGDTLINIGDTDPSNDITDTTTAGGDLGGVYPNPRVEGILSFPIDTSNVPLLNDYILKWDSANQRWVPSQDIISAGLTGAFVSPRIAGTGQQATPLDIAQQGAGNGQVLKWNDGSSAWQPADEEAYTLTSSGNNVFLLKDGIVQSTVAINTGTVYTAGDGIAILPGNVIFNTGDINANDDITNMTDAGGDLEGVYPNPTIRSLKGREFTNDVANPQNGQILKFFTGLGWTVVNEFDDDSTNEIQSISLNGFQLGLSESDTVTLPRYVGGTGIQITNDTVINNTGVLFNSPAGGDVTGTYNNMTVVGIQGQEVTTVNPQQSWVLRYNNGQWTPTPDDSSRTNEIQTVSIANDSLKLSLNGGSVRLPFYTGTPGVTVDNNSYKISLDPTVGGDVVGTYPTLTVTQIQGNPVSPNPPTTTQVLKWDGSSWRPRADSVDDDDSDPENEIQELSIATNVISLSNGGGSITLPPDQVNDADSNPTNEIQEIFIVNDSIFLTLNPLSSGVRLFSAGDGIDITNRTFTNTGDLDGNDDINIGTTADGDLKGTYPNPRVDGLQGVFVDSTAPNQDEVLTYNGVAWQALPTDRDTTNELQTLSIQGDTLLTLSNGGGSVPLTQYIYQEGIGIDITNNIISNTGDTNPADDVQIGDIAGGDLGGTYPNPSVTKIQGSVLDTSLANPSIGNIIKWNGSAWVPTDDLVDDADPDPQNEIQSLSLIGTDGVNTQIAISSVLTPLSIPISDIDADTTNEIQSLSISGLDLSISEGNTITLPDQSLSAGAGIDIVGSVVINTGDTLETDDINIGDLAGGDLSGTYPNPTVAQIQGVEVTNNTPLTGEVLKYNGTQWEPLPDLVDDIDADTTNEIQTLSIVGTTISISKGNSITVPNADPDSTNELQTLSLVGATNDSATIAISDGNTISIPISDVDADTTNEIQTLAFVNATNDSATFAISDGNQITIPLSDVDADTTNEIQTLALTGSDATTSTVSISDANSVIIPIEDADADSTNELQTLSFVGATNDSATFAISDGNQITIPLSDVDADTTNEIQTLTLAGSSETNATVSISDGNSIIIPIEDTDADTTNEIQDLTLVNSDNTSATISIEDGNSITIPISDVDADTTNEIQNLTLVNSDNTSATISIEDGNSITIPISDVDADTTNEIQTLSLSGLALSLSNGNTVTLPDQSLNAGAGIDIIGNVIINTGDTLETDDINIGDLAGGDLSGTYPNPEVAGLLGRPLSNAVPNTGEVIKWNGSQWEPLADSVNDDDADPSNEIQSLSISGTDLTLSGANTVSIPVFDGDSTNEIQTLSISGTTISLTDGGSVTVPIDDADADSTNEIQTLSISGTTISLTDGGSVTVPIEDADADTTNEIQTLAVTGDQLSISGANTVTIPDADTTNEIQTLSISGTTISLTDGGSVTVPIEDADADTTNEIQSLSISGTTISLTDGGSVTVPIDDADADTTNELQILSISGLDISISDGNTVSIPDQSLNAGAGIDIIGNVIINTGDTLATDDINIGDAAGGDLSGTFPNPTVVGIQGNPVTNTAPDPGEILKWNGTQWEPDVDLVNDIDADTTNEIQSLSLSGDQLSLSSANTITIPDADTTNEIQTLSIAGTTISLTDGGSVTVPINDADADSTNEIQSLSISGNDLSISGGNTVSIPVLDGDSTNEIQTLSISGTTISLTDGGSVTVPIEDADADSTNEIQSLSISGTTISLTDGGSVTVPIEDADADSTNELQTLSLTGNDLTLSDGNTVTLNPDDADADSTNEIQSLSIVGTTISLTDGGSVTVPVADADADSTNELQTLSISGFNVSISDGNAITIPDQSVNAGAGIDLIGNVIVNTGDTLETDDINIGDVAGGDLTGTYPNPTVAAIQGNAISNATPTAGEILQWSGTEWEPGTDLVEDADADSTNELQILSISGTTLSLSNGNSVTIPTDTYFGGTGIAISGQTIINIGDTDSTNDVNIGDAAGGDLSGTFPNPTVAGIQGVDVSATAPSTDQIYKYDGTEWVPSSDLVDDADADSTNELQTLSFVSATNDSATFAISDGNQITIPLSDVDADTTNELQTLGLVGNQLSLSDGNTITLPLGTGGFAAGAGISIDSANVITNIGDTLETDDINIGDAAGGDLSGTYPNPTVAAIQGTSVSTTAPTADQIFKYDGFEWVPSTDLVEDADADTTNELQILNLSGNNLTISDGNTVTLNPDDADADSTNEIQTLSIVGTTISLTDGGSVTVPVTDADADTTNELQTLSISGFNVSISDGNSITIPDQSVNAGAGISIIGNVISNTGDTLETDDINIGDVAGGDLSGTFPNPSVVALQGNDVASTTPTIDEVLKWNGSEWEPSVDDNTDADADSTNELQTLSIAGSVLSLSDGNSVNIPVNNYVDGPGIDITGLTITNIGDQDSTDDVNIGDAAGGDLSGTYPDPTVAAIQGTSVSTTAPTTDQIFKYDGTEWVPSSDLVEDADADSTNEIQAISISNDTINISDNVSFVVLPDGSETNELQTLSVSGTDLTISSGNTVTLNVDDADADSTNELQSISLSNDTISISDDASIVVLPDASATNEIQSLNIAGNNLSISGGNTITLDADSTNEFQSISISNDTLRLSDDASFAVLPDGSNVNELQSISLSDDTVRISNDASFVVLPDASETNEIQSLSIAGNDLSISGGNTITLDADSTNEFQSISISNDTLRLSDDASFAVVPDASTTNEIQSISLSNDTLRLSGDASFVVLGDTSALNELQNISFSTLTEELILTGTDDTVDLSNFIQVTETATGDLGGTVGNPVVDGIQGTSVSATSPDQGEVLTYDGTEWTPDTLSTSALLVNSSLIPDANNSYDIGSSSNRWSTLFLQNNPDVLSDARFKQQIRPLAYGLTELLMLQPVSYQLTNDPDQQTQLGFLAQEVQPVIGEVVNEHIAADSTESQFGMSYTELIPVIIKGIQEQQETIDQQQDLIMEQRDLIEEMRKELQEMKKETQEKR